MYNVVNNKSILYLWLEWCAINNLVLTYIDKIMNIIYVSKIKDKF